MSKPQSKIQNPQIGDWEKIVEIFEQATELAPGSRTAFLVAACPTDDVRREVEALLAADGDAEAFIETPAIAAAPTLLFDEKFSQNGDSTPADGKIGAYRIIREIGRGGMGAVYLASREDADFIQNVAVKLIKRGMDTDLVVRRFRHERQILARLNHPNIARLYDGGTSTGGTPYFVMEYVEGEELLDYCDRKNLNVNERLDIFRKICAAVSYAHQNLVVHRDLKPSNILITDDGEPKLLDFGISKILTSEADAPTGTATVLGMLTPKYASPEQFRGETVSTATDVYSLGVILYELLTGSLPYELTNRRVDEIARIISETDPVRPSSAVSGQKSVFRKKTGGQENRLKTEDEKENSKFKIQNSKSLKGDLDNIILKALKKEPERRYSSVEQFAEDVRRHQAGLPVSARSDTFAYRASKFVRRNRTAVVAAVLIFITLIGGIVATVWQKRRAENRYQIARGLANNVLFKYHDEIRALPGSMRVREMLVKDALEYLRRLRQDSYNDAELQREIALAYYKVGTVQLSLYDNSADSAAAALESFTNALKLQEELIAENPADLELRQQIADSYNKQGEVYSVKLDFENALQSFETARRHYEIGLSQKPDDARFLTMAILTGRSIDNLIEAPAETHLENARQMLVLAERGRQIAPADASLQMLAAIIYGDIGRFLGHPEMTPLNRLDEAILNLEKGRDIMRGLVSKQSDNRIFTGVYVSYLMVAADVLIERGETAAALVNNSEALKITKQAAEADRQNLDAQIQYAYALVHYARTLAAAGKLNEAANNHEQAQRIFDDNAKLTETNPALSELAMDLNEGAGDTAMKLGDFSRALNSYRKSLEFAGLLKRKTKEHAVTQINAGRLSAKIGSAQIKMAEKANYNDKEVLIKEAAESLHRGIESYKTLEGKNLLPLRDLRVYDWAKKEIRRFDQN